jgi:hypothetical protein
MMVCESGREALQVQSVVDAARRTTSEWQTSQKRAT